MTERPAVGADGTADTDAARRRFLHELGGLLAAAGIAPGAAAATAAATPAACLLTPAATEGPFYLDDAQVRADIRDDRPGQPLRLRIRVVDAGRGCTPVPGALVSIWHCDADGSYSGEGRGNRQARFLRGVQPTSQDGVATFMSVYPGWYAPRAIHIHFKVLLGQSEALTSQLYFSDTLNREVLGSHPAYRAHGVPSRATAQDPIAGSHPNQMRVRQAADAPGLLEAEFTVGIART